MAYLRFFSSLSEVLTAIAVGGGYASLFLIMFLEGMPLIGILIPGHVTIVAAGFLASVGVLGIVPVIVIGIAGAVAGDYGSFLLGRRYGWPLIDRLRRYFFIKDAHLERPNVS
jgi:undecaprenyl-diphosphatase